jgi:hypothetical protein
MAHYCRKMRGLPVGKKLAKARRRETARFFPADTRSIVTNSAMKPLSIAV